MEREEALQILPTQWLRSPVFWSFFLFGLALTLRLLALYYIEPYARGWDESFYRAKAIEYASGHSFSDKFFMPGWPWMLSWFARINTSAFFLRHCTVLLGSISVLLVYHLGRKVFSEKTGRLAALMMAFFPDHLLTSGMLQAEASIEACTIAAVLFSYWERRSWKNTPRRDCLAAFFYGAVVLVKHFIGLNFAGFLFSRSYATHRLRTILALCACFFIPIVLHGAYWGLTGRDPFVVINSPLKSASEWGDVHGKDPDFMPGKDDRVGRLEKHIHWLQDRPIKDTTKSIKGNLGNLWSPGTFGTRRLLTKQYSISPGWWFIYLHLFAYATVLILGTFGMAFGAPSPFRTQSILSLLILTAMAFALYMTSRYRVSFFFIFFLYGADVFTQPNRYLHSLRTSGWLPRAGFVAAISFLATIYLTRVRHLASYQ